MNSLRRGWRTVAAGLVLVLAGSVAARAEDKVEVTVLAIRATTSNKEISPELKEIAAELKKSFKYTGYKLVKKNSSKVEIGKAWSVELAGGYKASLTPQEQTGKKIKIKVEFTKKEEKGEKSIQNATVTLEAGGFQPWGGAGWKLDGDDVLIAAVSVK